MNKKQFSDLVDHALASCDKLYKIDAKFLKPSSGNVNEQVKRFKKLKNDAQKHFKKCTNQYCNLIHLHNLKNKNERISTKT